MQRSRVRETRKMESERGENKEENRALETEKEERVEVVGGGGRSRVRKGLHETREDELLKTSCPVPWARP